MSVWRFSAEKTNTIEDLTSKVSKVSCFTVNFEVPGGPGQKRQQYRGCRPLPRQITRGRAIFFPERLGLRAVALPVLTSDGICYVSVGPDVQIACGSMIFVRQRPCLSQTERLVFFERLRLRAVAVFFVPNGTASRKLSGSSFSRCSDCVR